MLLKKLLLILFFSAVTASCFSQEGITYLDADWKKCSREDARYYRVVSVTDKGFLVQDLYLNNKPQMIAYCSRVEPELIYDGIVTHFDENGKITSTGKYKKGVQYGLWMRTKNKGADTTYVVYYLDGSFNYEYKNLEFTYFGNIAPQYLGGSVAINNLITKNLKYPEKAKTERIGGKLDVYFVIDTFGKISNIKVLNNISKEIDEEGIRLIKLLDSWVPATRFNTNTTVAYTIPILFFPDEQYKKEYYDQESKKNIYTAFIDKNRKIVDSTSASFYTIYMGNDDSYKSGTNETYLMTGVLLSKEDHQLDQNGKREEKTTYYYDDRKVRTIFSELEGKNNGEFLEYYPNGKLKRKELYKTDSLIQGNCYTKEGLDTAYYKADYRHASFPGGEKGFDNFIKSTLKYPKKAKLRRISGTVTVQFTIDKYGNSKNISVPKSANKFLAEEALRVISLMPQWEQGYMIDHALSTIQTRAIVFSLK